jgi:PAS domain S-box-containing protein
MAPGLPSLANLRLSQKGLILLFFPLTLELILACALAFLLNQADIELAREAHSREILARINLLMKTWISACTSAMTYNNTHDPEIKARFGAAGNDLERQVKDLQKFSDQDESRKAYIERATGLARGGYDILSQAMSHMEAGQPFLLLGDMPRVRRISMALENNMGILDKQVRKETDAHAHQYDLTRQRTWMLLVGGSVFIFVVALLLNFRVNSSTAARLRVLMDNTVRLASGKQLNPPLAGNDEIAQLDRVFASMARALVEAAERERSIIEHAQDIICSVNPQGIFAAVSPASLMLWGYAPEELIGQNYNSLVSPSDLDATRQSIETLMAGETNSDSFENKMVKKDGAVVDMLWSVQWSSLDRLLFCVVHDITERKRAEQQIKESESRVRHIMESMPIGVLTITKDFHIDVVNPTVEKMFGCLKAQLHGRSFAALVQEGFDVTTVLGERAARSGIEVLALRQDGTSFPMELLSTAMMTLEGERFLVIAIDVTEKHEIEKIKKEFVAMVSHELRTPLSSIRGILELMAAGAFGEVSEIGRTQLGVADRNVNRLLNLVNDLLDLEKLESGNMDMEIEETPISSILEKSLESVRAFAEKHQVALTVPSTNARVMADGDRIVQVLVNIISNAVKFSTAGGSVEVAVEELPEAVEIKVRDHGRGIPPEYIDKVFEKFRQVESADAKKKGGTGLGLSICKTIVEQHGGEIGVASQPGEGTTFWFRLPRPTLSIKTKTPDVLEA